MRNELSRVVGALPGLEWTEGVAGPSLGGIRMPVPADAACALRNP